MRLFERLQYLSGYLLFLALVSEYQYIQLFGFSLILVVTALGIYFEGIRFTQFPFFISFIFVSITYSVFNYYYYTGGHHYPIYLSLILLFGDAISTFVMIVKGECDFSRFPITGPYQVGYKEFRTSIYDNEVSVFYPIDRENFIQNINQNNALQQRHGDKTVRGLAKASVAYGREDHLPLVFFRYLKFVRMNCVENATLSKDFTSDRIRPDGMPFLQKPLIPIVFSHGLSSNRNWNSGTCRDLASHGYLVFAIDHRDETSHYVESKDGKGMYYNNLMSSHDLENRSNQLRIREKELIALIDEIFEPEMLNTKKLGFPSSIKIEHEKVITAGHSFGGMTAIATAQLDQRVRACLTLDPWLFVQHKEILNGEYYLRVPMFILSSETFHPKCEEWFESWITMQSFIKHCQDRRVEHIVMKNTGHLHQTDVACTIPFENFVMTDAKFQSTTNESYHLCSQLAISFLYRVGLSNFYHGHVENTISRMRERWIKYDQIFEYKEPYLDYKIDINNGIEMVQL